MSTFPSRLSPSTVRYAPTGPRTASRTAIRSERGRWLRPGTDAARSSRLALVLVGVAAMLVVAGGARTAAAGPDPGSDCTGIALRADQPATNARFGRAISLEGDRAVIGAIFDPVLEDRAGAAYVFENIAAGAPEPIARLLASDGALDDQFGGSVAISGDAVVVGALNHDGAGMNAGAAYVFRRQTDGSWEEEAKLLAPDGAALDFFGQSVAIDGDLVAIGAKEDDDGAVNAGAVYLFRFDSGDWSFETKLAVADPQGNDFFGFTVAVDGDMVVAAATAEDEGAEDAGAVYVFRRESGTWSQEAKLVAPDARPGQSLGWSLAIEGSVLLAGAPFDREAGNAAGAAYVWVRDGEGAWSFRGKLLASDASASASFGAAVAIDGGIFAIGAYRARVDDIRVGAAYLFLPDEDGSDWIQASKYSPPGVMDNDNFGFALDLDAGRLLGGSRLRTVEGLDSAGEAYLVDAAELGCLCAAGTVDAGSGAPFDVLYVNGSAGGPARRVAVNEGELIVAYLLLPPAGGNGRYVVHANLGSPSLETIDVLPSSVGTSCFSLLLPEGATPAAIWNGGIGRRNLVGATTYFDGAPRPDPVPAPSIFLQLTEGDAVFLPVGTVVTIQGAVIDPGSASAKGGSVTNAIRLVVR